MVSDFEDVSLAGSSCFQAVLEVLEGKSDLRFKGLRVRGAIQIDGELSGDGYELDGRSAADTERVQRQHCTLAGPLSSIVLTCENCGCGTGTVTVVRYLATTFQ
ncbi:hypothetical protein Tdes44962_MAKER04063 [Teratosphaeria destructans]|uniref:Uncharacterized protein n=1 Tax=Teratosphaeria destructans TaxID=418781 RepID=A0A9W7W0H6_9PEZI|nr:hypothetical protein Tdes44962_MAKER04063 [Teratosphaeria destructans]